MLPIPFLSSDEIGIEAEFWVPATFLFSFWLGEGSVLLSPSPFYSVSAVQCKKIALALFPPLPPLFSLPQKDN